MRALVPCNDPQRYSTVRAEPEWGPLGKRLGKGMLAVSKGIKALGTEVRSQRWAEGELLLSARRCCCWGRRVGDTGVPACCLCPLLSACVLPAFAKPAPSFLSGIASACLTCPRGSLTLPLSHILLLLLRPGFLASLLPNTPSLPTHLGPTALPARYLSTHASCRTSWHMKQEAA